MIKTRLFAPPGMPGGKANARLRLSTLSTIGRIGIGLLALGVDMGPSRGQGLEQMTRHVSAAWGAQGRLMWVDATANVFHTVLVDGKPQQVDYTTTLEGVREIVRHCQAANINTLVVDVKPLSGEVLYRSAVAPRMRTWKGHALPDFDVLDAFVTEGHKAGLLVDADMNTLSEGHKYYNVGLAYQHPDWQSVVYTVDRALLAPDGARLSVRAPGEPDDIAKPAILTDDSTILGGEPSSGLVGLESTDREGGGVAGAKPLQLGQQTNVVLDSNNQVAGIVDSALLGDDPLTAPEGGHLIPLTRTQDRAWVRDHVKTGQVVRFDLRSARTPIAQAPSEKIACFVNVLHPAVRKHELDVVRELVSHYAIDGLVLDRCRYSNLYNDFSNSARDAFVEWLRSRRPLPDTGHRIANLQWPEDVFRFNPIPGEKLIEGPLYKPWLEFRAKVIRDWVREIATTARSLKPGIVLGTYVGSWYPKYFQVGVNWGSEKTRLRYDWFTPDYPETGYAEFFDWISTGCYYKTATRFDARQKGQSEKGTVEYAAELSTQAITNGAFVYPGVFVPDYEGKPEVLLRALEAATRHGQGWMIFDLSYIDTYDWWPVLEKAYPKEAPPPERLPGLLSALRSATDAAQ